MSSFRLASFLYHYIFSTDFSQKESCLARELRACLSRFQKQHLRESGWKVPCYTPSVTINQCL